MARWRLTSAHYLNVPGTEWEHKETSRETGKQIRKVYQVPRHLDPKAPEDWNFRSSPYEDGDIIVCHVGKGQPKDIEFVGDPTADMEPLDEEARILSSRIPQKKPEYAHLSLGEGTLEGLMKELAQAIATGQPAQSVSLNGADKKEIDDLKDMVKQLMAQNTLLMGQLGEKQNGSAVRR